VRTLTPSFSQFVEFMCSSTNNIFKLPMLQYQISGLRRSLMSSLFWDLTQRVLIIVYLVLGQPVGPMKQAVQFCLECLTMEGGTDELSWYVSKHLSKYCVTSHKSGGITLVLNIPPVFTTAKHILRSYIRQRLQNAQYVNIWCIFSVLSYIIVLLQGRR